MLVANKYMATKEIYNCQHLRIGSWCISPHFVRDMRLSLSCNPSLKALISKLYNDVQFFYSINLLCTLGNLSSQSIRMPSGKSDIWLVRLVFLLFSWIMRSFNHQSYTPSMVSTQDITFFSNLGLEHIQPCSKLLIQAQMGENHFNVPNASKNSQENHI